MRWLMSFVFAGLGVSLLVGVMALYWWVPLFKAKAMELGAELSGIQVLLIQLSDFTARYFYIVLPGALAICFWLCRVAVDAVNESSRTEHEA